MDYFYQKFLKIILSTVLLPVFLAGIFDFSAKASTGTYYVRTDGDNSCNGQGNVSYAADPINCAWRTITYALENVAAGETVRIQNLGSDYIGESASVVNSRD